MKTYLHTADIRLPDFSRVPALTWSVIACDQFTSEPQYWNDARALVANRPSALNLILPELYLSDHADERIAEIDRTMEEYDRELLVSHPDTMVYLERHQSDGRVRRGLLGAIDLEEYDFSRESHSLIRATEGTVVERIPPRLKIRENAELELPHIMILIDDPENTVLSPLTEKMAALPAAYDTDLMLGGGHLTGCFVPAAEAVRVNAALEALLSPAAQTARYGAVSQTPLLFAVGDGNHSLATAKTFYENLKKKIGAEAAARHPARYALAEIVNIHDPALDFEPIYRIVSGADRADLLSTFRRYLTACPKAGSQSFTFLCDGETEILQADRVSHSLPVGTLQKFLDLYVKDHPGVTVDYIHGEDSVRELAQNGVIGITFTGMQKGQLFASVMADGPLPRKTFSMGEARDKRYYMEARRIR